MKMPLSKLIVAAACVLCALLIVLAPAEAVSAQEALPMGGLESSLVPGLGVGGGQRAAEEAAARLSTPEALAEDARSRTAYAGYRRGEAISLAQQLFGLGSGWQSPLAGGLSSISYIGQRAAAASLPGGKRVLVESSLPLRSIDGSGSLQPVSLALVSSGSGYGESNPLVPVVISKSAAGGATFEGGVRVAPAVSQESEASETVGDSLFYPGVAQDTDFMLEPTPDGVEASWQLLSGAASGANALTFSLPQGAQLIAGSSPSAAAEVRLEGRSLLKIMPAVATEADGAGLPVTYTAEGDTLTTHVDLAGAVDFPVEVDPIIAYEYGGSKAYWGNWAQASEGNAYFEGGQGNTGILAGIRANSVHSWAAWSISAPGWEDGESSITRVEATKLWHVVSPNSNVETGIVDSDGSSVWSESGKSYQAAPLNTHENVKGATVVFCAEASSPVGSCNESYGGAYYHLSTFTWATEPEAQYSMIEATSVRYIDTSHLSASFGTGSTTTEGFKNVFAGGTSSWFGPGSKSVIEYSASDPAFGVATMALQLWNGSSWETIVENNYETEGGCNGIQCGNRKREVNYANLAGRLPEGEDQIRVYATDPSSGVSTTSATQTLDVDAEAPHGLKVTNAGESKTINLTEGQAGDHVTIEAQDGHGSTPSSGIAALAIEIDEKQIGTSEGSCSPGPCSAHATWTINGANIGAGTHTMIVTATDGAGNVTSAEYALVIHAATPVAAGPGSVNPQSGDFAMDAADATLTSPDGGTLAVSRHYDSRNTQEGGQGPLGPEWTLETASSAYSLTVQTDGVAVNGPKGSLFFTGPNGEGGGGGGGAPKHVFSSTRWKKVISLHEKHVEFSAPSDDSALRLFGIKSTVLRGENPIYEYVLENTENGTTITFQHPESSEEWLPTITAHATSSEEVTVSYTTLKVGTQTVAVPDEEVSPHGTKLSCPPELASMQRGCRALLFYYGSQKTEQSQASGEQRSEWGWHAGRLAQVDAAAWNPVAKEMQETPVAEYSYDGSGRLRAEWDPQVKSPLKTIYGYNASNEITAVSPPGQQPWLMTYGTTSEDESTGRLIKIARAKASTAPWGGHLPTHSEEPTVSGSPFVSNRLAASTGKWENAPLAYSYQWERCSTSGSECTPILGANNANYSPASSDVGHALKVQVSATNAGGTTTVASTLTERVSSTGPQEFVHHSQSIDSGNSIAAVSCVPSTTDCVVSDSKGNAFYSTNVSAKGEATWHSWSGPGSSPSEAIACPTTGLCLLADGSHSGNGGSLYYASSLGGSWSEAYTPSYGVDAIACVSTSLCVDGQDGDGYMRFSTKPASSSWTLEDQGNAAMIATSCLSSGLCALADNVGDVHIAPNASAVEKDSWTQTDVDGSTPLTGISCVSSSLCVAVDDAGHGLDLLLNSSGAVTQTYSFDIDGSHVLTGVSCPTESLCANVDSVGNFLSESSQTGMETTALGGDLTSISCASASLCLTAGTAGQVVAVDPSERTSGGVEGAQQSPQPGTTIEYDVPVSGTGAPYAMGKKEVEVWGQKDTPTEATEIFPEEHPQGWPANGNTGATAYYTDEDAQTVNVANPAGGIATTEYGQNGSMTRSLTADNRVKALGEPHPAEAAESLATITKYNEENSQITETLAPTHQIKLADGETTQARQHVRYYYDEGAPENEKGEPEPYDLVTKTVTGALLSNGEEKDTKTTLTSYSGQENLGWKLRAATSTTIEPASSDLVSSTKYNKETGAVEETRSPGGNAESVSPLEPSFTFGSAGSGGGQFNYPQAVATAANGDVWVADKGKSRLEVFTASGSFVAAYGSAGSGEGQFAEPCGIAINQTTGNVYVADTQNRRVEELSAEGRFIRAWSQGSEYAPVAIAVDGAGHVWVTNYGKDDVQEFSETGVFIREFGSKGSGAGEFEGAQEIAFSQGMLYVVDKGDDRVEEFTTLGRYVGEFGSGVLDAPWGIAVAPVTGDLYVSNESDSEIDEFSPDGKFLNTFGNWGSESGELQGPTGLATGATGDLYVADQYNNRVSVWQPPEAGAAHMTYSTQWGSEGSGEGQFGAATMPAVDAHGDVWVSDYDDQRVDEFTAQGKLLGSYGKEGSGNLQFYGPTGVAVNQATGDVYVGDCYNNRVQELNSKGEFVRAFGSYGEGAGQLHCPGGIAIDSSGDVWVADTENDRIEEFSETGAYIASYGSKGSGELQFDEPVGITIVGNKIYVADAGNNRIQELTTSGSYVRQWGRWGTNASEFKHPEGIAANSAGDIFVLDSWNDRIQEFSPTGHYLQIIGSFGEGNEQLKYPLGITLTPAGDIYAADAGNHRIQKWIPVDQAVHDTRIVYYTAGEEAGVGACENHVEWVGLACRTEPVAQPTDSASEPTGEQLPQLPVITTEYNMWDQPVQTKETRGATTRTQTTTYQEGRATEQAVTITGSSGTTALPPTKNTYSTETGALIEQHTENGTIKRTYNSLGELTSYTDAAGSETTYNYDQYGRPTETNFNATNLDGMASTQTAAYNETTGQIDQIEASSVGTFTINYDAEGRITSERYPNNMLVTHGYNATGEATSISYEKTNHCSGTECDWFHENITPTINGRTGEASSPLATTKFAYDALQQMTSTQEEQPSRCISASYEYGEEEEQTTLTTHEAASPSGCTTEHTTIARHTYDEATRLTDEGVTYDTLGDITGMPEEGATPSISRRYFANGQLQTETQGARTTTYTRDPEGRVQTTETSEHSSTTDIVTHYANEGGAPSWSYNQTTKTWVRSIPGIDGPLATQKSGEEPTLEIHGIRNEIVGTASLSESSGKPLKLEPMPELTNEPQGEPEWLSASDLRANTPQGTVAQDGATYTAQTGPPLVTETETEPALANEVEQATVYFAPSTSLNYAEMERKSNEAIASSGSYTLTLKYRRGREGAGVLAHAAFNPITELKKFANEVSKEVKKVIHEAKQALKTDWNLISDIVKSDIFQEAGACVEGAQKLNDIFDSPDWEDEDLASRVVFVSISLIGCVGGVHDVDWRTNDST